MKKKITQELLIKIERRSQTFALIDIKNQKIFISDFRKKEDIRTLAN